MIKQPGLTRAIDELGLALLKKDIELELKQEEIEKLNKRMESIEQYIQMYDEYLSYDLKKDGKPIAKT